MSKGERQIFILALYWAIIEISGQNIPFVIDTPYARIDANHRREISEKFFPNISDQVIILSTDEEINEEYYRIINLIYQKSTCWLMMKMKIGLLLRTIIFLRCSK